MPTPEAFNPVKKKPKPIREKRVERAHKDGVAADGGWSIKLVSPGISGVPDDLDLYGTKPMVRVLQSAFGATHPTLPAAKWDELAQALLATAITFTECKAPGKKPTPLQERVHARLRALGFTVNVVDQVRKP